MKKIYCVSFGKYNRFTNPKISYVFGRIVILPIICGKCQNEDEKIFKEQESIEILKILDLIENI